MSNKILGAGMGILMASNMVTTTVSAKENLNTLTTSVEIAKATLKGLEEQKAKLEKQNKELLESVQKLAEGYDISDKDALEKETGEFLEGEKKKAEEVLYLENDLNTDDKDELGLEIAKLEEEVVAEREKLEKAQEALDEAKKKIEGIPEIKELLEMELSAGKYIVGEDPIKDYETLTYEDAIEIQSHYKDNKDIKISSTIAGEAIDEEDGEDMYTIKRDENGNIERDKDGMIVLTTTKKGKNIVEGIDKYLTDVQEKRKKIEEDGEKGKVLKAIDESKETIKQGTPKKDNLDEKKDRLIYLEELPAKIEELRALMAKDEVFDEVTKIHESVKKLTKKELLTEDLPKIENGLTGYAERYNKLIQDGKDIQDANNGTYEQYENYLSKEKRVDVQIALAKTALKGAEDRLSNYKQKLNKDKVENETVKTEQAKQESLTKEGMTTGVAGVNLIIPAGLAIAGIAGAIGLKKKKQNRH